jgi:hypothetical protein
MCNARQCNVLINRQMNRWGFVISDSERVPHGPQQYI